MQLPLKTLLSLLPFYLQVAALASGSGTTTRYWDCCKPSCAWSGKTTLAAGSTPVNTCSISNTILTDSNTASACDGGSAYQCSDESPWAVDDNLAYGYAAVNIAGGTEESWCCACYELTFTSGAVAGKKMIIQATNTGGDLASNQFDLSIPGGGAGIFNGYCTAQYGTPSTGWGAQYGGVASRSDCDSFPAALKDGCYWRFDWFMGSDNPTVEYTQVACPAALTANTGCIRADDGSAPAAPSSSSSVVAPASTSTVVAQASSNPITSTTIAATPPVPVSSSEIIALTSTDTTAHTDAASSLSPVGYASSSSLIILTSVPSTATTTSPRAVSETPVTSSEYDGDDYCEL